MSQSSMLPGLLPPLEPHEYLRLRREAAGLSIEQAARPHWHRPSHRADVEATTARYEQPGQVIRNEHLLNSWARNFSFEPDVYRQLRDEPADRHPTVCRGCGCTSWDPCHAGDGRDCTIDDGATCTACQERAQRRSHRWAA